MSGLMRIWRPESIRILLVPLLLMLSTSIAVSQTPDLDNETCLDCHEEMEQTIEGTPHQLSQAGEESRIRVACVDCHAGGETHIEDPQEDNIGNPARHLTNVLLPARKEAEVICGEDVSGLSDSRTAS